MASIQRQPFAELGSSRLQGLAAQKNCQNAITDLLSKANASDKTRPSLASATKRPHTPVFDDEELDSENVDPALISSKRSKGLDGKGKPVFKLTTTFSDPSLQPMDHTHEKPSSPASPLTDKFSFGPLPSGTSSAPAGRSPKHKRVGILSKQRSSMSPFRRVDPPRFGSSKKSTSASSGLPFSIDAALSGTLSGYSAPTPAKPKGPSLDESQPKGWFFDIHEDTPDEEAANIMEHSTCILDISSDDEAGPSKPNDDRGKENVPPPDHDVLAAANGSTNTDQDSASVKSRRSAHVDDMVDEGQERAPLGMLPAADFYATGLDARSVEVVAPEADVEEADVEHGEPASPGPVDELDQADDENAPPAAMEPTLPPVEDACGGAPTIVIHEDVKPDDAVPAA